MPTSIKYLADLKIVESNYSGVVTPDELQQSMANGIELTTREKTGLILSDCTTMLEGHSVVDIFYFLSKIDRSVISHITKEAMILPLDPKAAENVKFYETTCQNRGLNVRSFDDRESALAWLLQ